MSDDNKKKKGYDFLEIEKHNAEVESENSQDLSASGRGRELERRVNQEEMIYDEDDNEPTDTE